ncbi:MAG: YihA family ribosome biogenesis GTP-binding protein [Pseudomonadales bacterium]|nr:YihA family ribosome biogenesis GTP-binding protein [Pseudomonadales bacterium]
MQKISTILPLQEAIFLKSAAKLSQCPRDVGSEIAFCGRSNAGKSSAINYLTDQQKLARTSKTPGRTQLINFFSVTDSIRLVDLPGYGYAKVPIKVKSEWHRNIDAYFQNRQSLKGLILVMDIRHPLKEFDLMMLEWSKTAKINMHIILTKADKFKRGTQQSTLFKVRKSVPEHVTVQTFSSTTKIGKQILVKQILSFIQDGVVKQ